LIDDRREKSRKLCGHPFTITFQCPYLVVDFSDCFLPNERREPKLMG
jgi:hypothetical protein